MAHTTQSFADSEGLAQALADTLVAVLARGLAARGQASLALSGGSTPRRLFQVLSRRDLDWSRVSLTLVDDRDLPPSHPRSNAGLLCGILAGSPASAARFLPLRAREGGPAEGLVAALDWPLDAVVLGMGTDGHTASWFPGADRLDAALDRDQPPALLPLVAPGAPEPRLSFNRSALLRCRDLFLHIEGKDKQAALAAAWEPGPLAQAPIRAMLFQDEVPVRIFTTPPVDPGAAP
jgi:6-phosphogluconolactonase